MYEIGWTNCQLTERIAGKQGGFPLLEEPAFRAQQIVEEARKKCEHLLPI
jgi:hypothetical protein